MESIDTAATTAVDLTDGGSYLSVDISDALSERDWVKFTVHTKTSMLQEFNNKSEFSVIRLHEEFVWLHDAFHENQDYEGYVIPPAPPRPDFDASKEKLRKLGDAEGNLTKDEFDKMKQELEAEYLATFKKTVAMHETFLTRLAAHPIFSRDRNFHIFLEYEKELQVRGKNKKEKLVDIFNIFSKTSDEYLLGSTVKDVDEYFEGEKKFLLGYFSNLKDANIKADKMNALHKGLADNFIKLSLCISDLAALESGSSNSNGSSQERVNNEAAGGAIDTERFKNGSSNNKDQSLENFLAKVADCMEKMRRIEARVASDQDLKLSDTLRYHTRDTAAAKDLLYRRLRCLSNYESANKKLDYARARQRDVAASERAQQEACARFENVSSRAKDELKTLKTRRVAAFQKSLTELAELELKHSRAHAQMLKATINSLKAEL